MLVVAGRAGRRRGDGGGGGAGCWARARDASGAGFGECAAEAVEDAAWGCRGVLHVRHGVGGLLLVLMVAGAAAPLYGGRGGRRVGEGFGGEFEERVCRRFELELAGTVGD